MNRQALRRDIEAAITKNGYDTFAGTPDFILSQFLMDSLSAFELATIERDRNICKNQNTHANDSK